MPHRTGDMSSQEESALEPIAICGMACRLPGGVDSASSLWEMLINKRTGQTPKVPESRFNIDAHYHENQERPGSFNVMGGYFIDGRPQDFDPTAFGMTPIEAQWLDPQQRRMLEVTYECLESAGIPLDVISGSNTAVFVGSFTSDYQQMSTRDPDFRHNYVATGVDPGIISNRIGNVFNLNGPSFTINTACSSSVYAIHNACHALRARDSDSAIAGGVNLIMTVDQHMNTAKLGILSPTSTCHTFDASADGYGRAEGAGALFLKRLSDAIRDGDPVRGVIRSSAVNTNGKVDGMGITHPSAKGQERVVRLAYKKANLDPNRTIYAELHGTGTPVGDPIEARATANAMNDTRSTSSPLFLGAIKPNIGHSEAASGIFAVMKAALMTEAAVIPGVALLDKLNPNILEEEWNVKVNVDTIGWPEPYLPRRASVSSFGYGGTNGHIIVESVESLYPWYQHGKSKDEVSQEHASSRPFLLCFSAHDKSTLSRNVEAVGKVASRYHLTDLAYTLNMRRTRHTVRAFAVAREGDEAAAFVPSVIQSGTSRSGSFNIGFLFTGQGAQWAGMGQHALRNFPPLLQTIRRLDGILARLNPRPSLVLEDFLLGDPLVTSKTINNAEIAQPLCTAIQIALVDLLSEWDITPSVSVGHSSGEIGAAYAAGLLSAPEAIITAYCRGMAVKESAPTGSMLAVGLGAEQVDTLLSDFEGRIFVACENSPSSVTLSGLPEDVADVKARFDAAGIFVRELKTGRAYHSPHMSKVGVVYEAKLKEALMTLDRDDLAWTRPRTGMVSSVTGSVIVAHHLPCEYWSANLRQRVLFDTAVTAIGTNSEFASCKTFVEIGPHSALAGPFKQIRQAHNFEQLAYLPSLVRQENDTEQLLSVAGSLFLSGFPVDLDAVNSEEPNYGLHGYRKQKSKHLLVDLPPYQWNYAKQYWAEPRPSAEQRSLTHARHDLLGRKVAGLSNTSQVWRNILRHRDIPWLADHKLTLQHLGGTAIFPAAGHMSLAIEALRQTLEGNAETALLESVTLRDVDIKTALVIPDTDNGVETLVRFEKLPSAFSGNQDWYSFYVESLSDSEWTLHCQGKIFTSHRREPSQACPVDQTTLTQRVPGKRWYDAFDRVGFNYGSTFQQVRTVRTDRKVHHAAGDVNVLQESPAMKGESRYILHPSTVDACLQLIIISIHAGKHKEIPYGVVPTRIEEATLVMPGSDDVALGNAIAWTDEFEGRYFGTHTQLFGPSGKMLLDIKNLRCVAYEAAIPQDAPEKGDPLPFSAVEWLPDLLDVKAAQVHTLFQGCEARSEVLMRLVRLATHRSRATKVLVCGNPDDPCIYGVASATSAEAKLVVSFAQKEYEARDHGERIVFKSWDDALNDKYDLIVADEHAVSSNLVQTLVNQGALTLIHSPTPLPDRVVEPVLEFTIFDHHFCVTAGQQPPPLNGWPQEIHVLGDNQEGSDDLVEALQKHVSSTSARYLRDFNPVANTGLVINDSDGMLFPKLDEATFTALRRVLSAGIPSLWLTRGAQKGSNVGSAMALGLLRVIRSEQATAKIVLLDTDDWDDLMNISKIIIQKMTALSQGTCEDDEFWLHEGVLHIPRIRSNVNLNSQWTTSSSKFLTMPMPRGQKLTGRIADHQLVFQPSASTNPELSSDEIEIQVNASVAQKGPNSSFLVYGQVLRTESSTGSSMIGQSVVGITCETFTSTVSTNFYSTINVDLDPFKLLASLSPILDAVSIESAIHFSSKDKVLLLPGPEELTKALIKLAELRQWNLCVVRPAVSREMYDTQLVSDKHGYKMYKDDEFLTLCAQEKPDVIIAHDFSLVSQEAWRCIKPSGRFILHDSIVTSALDSLPFTRGAAFLPVSLKATLSKNPSFAKELVKKAVSLFESSEDFLNAKFETLDVHDICDVQEIHRHHSPVIKYTYDECDVKMTPQPKKLQLSPDATYFLVGCLGGLGRSLTRFMFEHGARHFTFLSRSGADKSEAADIVTSLQEQGALVDIFRADVSDEVEVKRIVSAIHIERPIRGVVHAAMVLKDGLFEQMDYSSFAAAIEPKANGALSLHNAFSGINLDFFVMTSSISAVLGNPGQANYSAANSFLDALAFHRNKKGLAATSLALPMVLDVGVVAESDSLETQLTRKGLYGIDEYEMLRGFEVAMSQPVPQPGQDIQPSDSQIIMGLEPSELAKAVSAIDVSDAYWYTDPRLKHVRSALERITTASGPSTQSNTFMQDYKTAMAQSQDKGLSVIAQHIAKRVSSILMIPVEDFELNGPSIASYGLDSMIGAEMRTWLFKEFGLDFPFQKLLATTLSFVALARVVAEVLDSRE